MRAAETRIHEAALRIFAERGGTHLTISELAEAAGVARGTVYNHLGPTDTLFEDIAARLADEMRERVMMSFVEVTDHAQRLANGIRFFIRRGHEEPLWGRFIIRFALGNQTLQGMWTGPAAAGLREGLEQKRYRIDPDQLSSALAMIAGATLAAMMLVLEGHRTWRTGGADAAEFVLRALGIAPREAKKIASTELPPLPRRS